MESYMRTFLLLLLCVFTISANAQRLTIERLGDATGVRTSDRGATITARNGVLRVSVIAPTIVKIHLSKTGVFDDVSYAVVSDAPTGPAPVIAKDGAKCSLRTDSMLVEVSLKPIAVTVRDAKGNVLVEDHASLGISWAGSHITNYKVLRQGERFIGLGEKTGPLDRRGNGYTHWNTDFFGYPSGADPIYMSTPFYMGLHSDSLMYGLFLDNSSRTRVNFGASNDRFSSFGVEDGDLRYYVIAGHTVPGILASYAQLTGTMPLPPKWSIGFQQCRYSYYPDTQVLSIARTFRERKIPADVIYLDIHYMQDYKLFTWDSIRFRDPKRMIDELTKLDFTTTVIIDPGIKIEKGYAPYEEGLGKDLFLKYSDGSPYTGQVWPGWCTFTDFTKQDARSWWGTQFKGLVDVGVRGFWNDMNEIATWGQFMPDNILFSFEGTNATHLLGRNVYGMQMARSTYEGTKALLGNERPFILTRAGYNGIQRYSAVWTGDNQSNDDHMMAGIRLLNSMGLTGVPFVGMDVGGFTGGPSKELFARWTSVSAFTPFFRAHVAIDNKSQEPWSFGERVEQICRNYISLRYRLLPDLYSSFYESSVTGMPIMRSMAVTHPFESSTYDWQFLHQFTVGSDLMVCPSPSYERFTRVWFPPSGAWYSLYNDQRYDAGSTVIVDSPIDRLPVYVHEGGMLLMQSLVQSTREKPTDTLEVHVYNGSTTRTKVWYEDDGISYDHLKGANAKRVLIHRAATRELVIGKTEGSYKSGFTTVKLVMHGYAAAPINRASVNGSAATVRDARTSMMRGIERFDPLGGASEDTSIPVQEIIAPLTSDQLTIRW